MKWLWFARYDYDNDPLEDTIEGEVEADSEAQAIERVRSGEADRSLGPFDDAWDVYVRPKPADTP